MTTIRRRSVESLESREMLTATTIQTPQGVSVEGGVSMDVNEVGSFGDAWGPENYLDAFYNPIGSATAAEPNDLTVYESGLAIGSSAASDHRFLDVLADDRQFTQQGTSTAISEFTLSDCDLQLVSPSEQTDCRTGYRQEITVVDVVLTQTIIPVFESTGLRSGSLLTQTYAFSNRTTTKIEVDAIRYLDLHLDYESNEYDGGGGRLGSGDMFEIDRRTGATPVSDEIAFGVLLDVDHDQPANNAFDVDAWDQLSDVLNGAELNNVVQGDSAMDGDLLIDQNGFDPTLWTRHAFEIPASGSVNYVSRLFFGSDKPTDASIRDVDVDLANRTVTIEFDDEVDVDSTDVTVFDANGQQFNAIEFDYDILTSTATWEFGVNFEPNNFKLSDDITDLSGDIINPLGDVNGDGSITADDIDDLFAAINSNSADDEFDLNGDGNVDDEDVNYLVEVVLETRRGDVDLNGKVEFADFLTVSNNFGQSGGWADGDFDGSGTVDFADFLVLSANFGYGT